MNRAAAPPPSTTADRAELRAAYYRASYWRARVAMLDGLGPSGVRDVIFRALCGSPPACPYEGESITSTAARAVDDALAGREPQPMRTA